jgi:hypothetical protein
MADLDRDIEASRPITITNENETLIVDVLQKADGTKRLAVDSETSISTELGIQQESDQNITLDDVIYYDIYSVTGIKTVSGFAIQLSDKKTFVRLEIDGVEIFDINIETFKEISNLNAASQPPLYIAWNDNLKVFYFTPSFPIKSTTSIKVQARSKLGQSKKYIGSIIQIG